MVTTRFNVKYERHKQQKNCIYIYGYMLIVHMIYIIYPCQLESSQKHKIRPP